MWISYSMFFENRMCLEIYTSKQNMKDFMEAEVKKLLTTEKSLCDPHRVGLSPYVAKRVPFTFLCYSG